MRHLVSIERLRSRGVTLRFNEAIAVVQGLARRRERRADCARPPFGRPTPSTVLLSADGSVCCSSCASTLSVLELAIVLDDLMPHGTRSPGGMRYALARALHEVDAPPFDSAEEFLAVLRRYQPADAAAVRRDLVARFLAVTAPAEWPDAPPVERRRAAPGVDDLRRYLREADARAYEYLRTREDAASAVTTVVPPPPGAMNPSSRDSQRVGRAGRMSAAAAAAVALVAAGALLHPASREPGATRAGARVATAGPEISGAPAAGPAPAVQARRERRPTSSSPRRGEPDARRPRLVPTALPAAHASTGDRRIHDGDEPIVQGVDTAHEPVFAPGFASDGTALFDEPPQPRGTSGSVSSGREDLRVMRIADDRARNYHVRASPDGRRVAFDSDRDGARGVYVADRDGTHLVRVSGPGYAALPAWSPEGGRLVFARAEPGNPAVWNLWLLQVDTGELRRVTSYASGQPGRASWFPDGRRIGYSHRDQLVVHDLSSGETHAFRTPVEGRRLGMPAVSPDGATVVFRVNGSGAWLLDLADGSMRCVLSDPTADEFAWSRDGRRLAYHSARDNQWGIWFMAPRA